MEISTNDFRKGLKLEIDGKPYVCIKCDFTNPGKGSAFYKLRIKNLETGAVIERTFKSGVATGAMQPDLDEKEVEYLYNDPDGFNFMDQSTFETIHVATEYIEDAANYLQEGIKVELLYYKGKPISIELPNFVELAVTETDPGLKGDTAQGGLKKAIMETGLQVNVPLFIKEGETLKIDTRTGDYVERVNK
ncbi:translation elongation factor P [Bacteriovorax sp. BAL6_X]|uniref:elongation factor P n=1 Tax=Bacteriovorax sp. BAL6_X TaxID=1201290 RepID=UPI000386B801|nr:elongation factor P [Bacteriovorax sp. BAL6_X]EPZ50338.1 translation elongation factor P [Bacteriovorax sp. BAL6_X]